MERARHSSWFTAALSTALAAPLALSISPDALPKAPNTAPTPSLGAPVSGVQAYKAKPAAQPKQPANYKATATSWPTAASGALALTAGSPGASPSSATKSNVATTTKSHAAGTPVWAQAVTDSHGAYAGPSSLGVKVLSHQAASDAGVSGVLTQITPTGAGRGQVRVGVDYSSFAQAYGGDYASRLRLVELPACALTTPQLAACRTQTPLASTNDGAGQSVSATLPLGTAVSSNAVSSKTADRSAPTTDSAAANSAVVLAVTSSTSGGDGGGGGGQYGATSLKPSGSWSAGGSSGTFDYSYPMTVPQAVSTLVPSVGLSYDSGSVDGQIASTQSQSSWIGDGWSMADSFIEQSFVTCSDTPEGVTLPTADQTGDMCYDGPILTLSLGGSSSSLVWDSGAKAWKASTDNGEVITQHKNANNGTGTYDTDYWTVTTRDGTVYSFGLNHLPGWNSKSTPTNSVDTEPVYSANPGDPCYNSAGFTSSVCTMAYRWHLDYVKDLHGNAMAYYYAQDTNYYGEDVGAHTVSYVRDSHLAHVDYGFTDGNAYGTVPDSVVFSTGDRCVSGTCDPLNSTNAPNWPDVPDDLICPSTGTCDNSSPSFFSTARLTSIAAKQYNGSGWNTVDTWDLNQTIPTTGTYNTSTLWLSSITHTGSDTSAGGSAVTLPSVSFGSIMMANRVNYTTGTGSGLGPLNRYRISTITTETGSVISVKYELVDPCSSPVTLDPSTNTSSCFPAYWTPDGATTPYLDWFNKYSVQSVSQSDPSGGSAGLFTQYKYLGHAAWHYDDNELVPAKYRTYGQFRGYGDVQTRTGQGSDPLTLSEDWYYRGMSDDNDSTAVTLTDTNGGTHDDADQLAGSTLEDATYTYDGGSIDHSTVSSYWVSAPTATRTRTGLPALTANAIKPVETWTKQALTDTNPPSWRETATVTSYDTNAADPDFGLPLFVDDTGDLALVGTGSSQETCEQTTYAPANTDLNLVGLVAATETDAKPCGGTGPGASSAPTAAQMNALTAPASLNKATDVVTAGRTIYDDQADATTWPQPASISQGTPTLGEPSIVQAATGYANGAFTYKTKSATVYDGYGRPTATYDALGDKTSTSYTMTSYGTVTGTSNTNALGQTQSTTLDPERTIVTSATDANNITTTVHYDGLGRTTAVWYHGRSPSDPADAQYTYTVSSTVTAVTTQTLNDESGYSTSTQIYDALLRPRQTQKQALTVSAGRIVNDTFYDTHGWVTKTNADYWDPSSAPTTTLVTVPDNKVHQQTLTSYDGLGRAVEVQSLDNASNPTVDDISYTQYTGDKTVSVPPTGGVATASVTDALGRSTELDQYTSAPTVTTGTAGGFTTVGISGGTTQATQYTYDALGRPYQTIDAKGETWSTTYDYLGQTATTIDPDSGTTGTTLYDAAGHTVQTTDSAGHTQSFTYDALGRKTAEYDAPLNAQSSSNEIASWVYDNSNDEPGVSDAIGQLTTQTSYTSAGAFTIQSLGFNVFGASLGESYMVPGGSSLAGTYTYKHAYSKITGNPSATQVPAVGGLSQEILNLGFSSYNGIDVPSTLGGLNGYTQNITYTALGQVAQETIGSNNNASITNTYDPHTGAITDSRLVNTAVSSTPLDESSYAYDASGNPTSQTEIRNGAQNETQCYNYDALDRLTQAWTTNSANASSCGTQPTSSNVTSTVGDGIAGAAYWTSWTFDPLGQPKTQTNHSLTGATDTTTTYNYGGSASTCTTSSTGAHTLNSTSTTGPSGTTNASYCNNGLGETTGRPGPGTSGQQTLTWDDLGRLSTITTAAGGTGYLYDANGNVLERTDPGTTTLFLPGQQLQLNTSNNAITATRFIPLPGGGQAVESGTTNNYQFELADPHGTATISLDATVENPSWQQYTPYGAPRGSVPGTWNDPNGYLDQPQDTGTGLTTLGAREYDPVLGRFLSVDPIFASTNPQSLNGYTYAAANPVSNSDATGKMVDCGNGWCGDPGGCNLMTHCGTTDVPPPPTTAPSGGSGSGSGSGSSSGSGSGSSSGDGGCSSLHGKMRQLCAETAATANDICDAACLYIQQLSTACTAAGGELNGTTCEKPVPPKPHHWWEAVLAVVAVVAIVVVAVACIVQPELLPAALEAGEALAPELAEGAADTAAEATSTAVEAGADASSASDVAASTAGESASSTEATAATEGEAASSSSEAASSSEASSSSESAASNESTSSESSSSSRSPERSNASKTQNSRSCASVEVCGPGEVRVGNVKNIVVKGGTFIGKANTAVITDGGTFIGDAENVVQIGSYNTIGELGPEGANSFVGNVKNAVQALRVFGGVFADGQQVWPLLDGLE
jgi:RHS repeat-associated protein